MSFFKNTIKTPWSQLAKQNVLKTRLKLSVRTAKSGVKYLLRFNSSMFYMKLILFSYLGVGKFS